MLNAPREDNRFCGRQTPMNFDEEIDAITNYGSHALGVVDCITHLLDVGLKVDLVIAFIKKGVEVTEGRKARVHLYFTFDQHFLDRVFINMSVYARFGPCRAAQQFKDRHAKRFALDIP